MAYCDWKNTSPENQAYHDKEWGIPVHDDRRHFECLMLEALQCGLSWSIIIRKRDTVRACFDDFDYVKVAAYTEADVERILNTEGMIRSRRKVEAIIHNARCFQKIADEFGSFSEYIWRYTDNVTVIYDGHDEGRIPSSNALSEDISRDLRKRGLKYLGPVTVYAYLQAAGIINDHDRDCPCFKRIVSDFPTTVKKCEGDTEVICYR